MVEAKHQAMRKEVPITPPETDAFKVTSVIDKRSLLGPSLLTASSWLLSYPLTRYLALVLQSYVLARVVTFTSFIALVVLLFKNELEAPIRFAWNCFFKPLGKGIGEGQQGRLESFYRGQADGE